jgi:hypothetical protein
MIEGYRLVGVLAALSICMQSLPAAAAISPAQKCLSSKMKAAAECWSKQAKCYAAALVCEFAP